MIRLSSDDFIEEKARIYHSTYSEMFPIYIKEAQKHFVSELERAISLNHHILMDRTNLSIKSRATNLAKIPSHYYKVANVFVIDEEKLFQRLTERARDGHKVLPVHIVKSMMQQYEQPSITEGFDEILFHRQ